MKLEVDLMICKEHTGKQTIKKISIQLNKKSLICFPDPSPNFNKFKKNSTRLLREIKKNTRSVRIETPSDIWSSWEPYTYVERHEVFYIESGNLLEIKLRTDIKSVIKNELGLRIKGGVHNPSREKSQMEYRKRAYYGKCKR